jgi:two-component system, NtrC family, nitrogen regulation sensor histidine kinase NtrY
MGFDRRFTLVLIGWLAACLVALTALAAALVTPGLGAVRIVAALLVMAMLAGLLNHIGRTNRTVARFVEALHYGDFSTRFDGRGGSGFDTLGQSLDAAMRGLQAQRDRTVEELRFLEALTDDVPVALLTVDREHGVALINKAARRLFAAHRGTMPSDFAIYGETFAARLADPAPPAAELLLLRSPSGPQRAIVRCASLERLGLTTRAITVEPVQGTLDTIEMATQTDLVRVLTHEILNSLTPVTSLASSTAHVLSEDAPDLELARTASGTLARRAEGLENFIRSYRAVAHVPEPRRQRFRAEPFARDLSALFAAEWPDLSLSTEVAAGLDLDADPDLLAQALINLLRNAAQATREQGGSKLVELQFLGSPQGTQIVVADRGAGVPQALRGDIFLPFFTTRAKGTGVGLNLVRQIVIAHGWTIDVADGAEGGAVFRIFVA